MGAPRPAGPQPRDGLQRALPLDPHGPIGRGPPLREPRVDTADDVHVRARQAGRDRADLAVAEWEPVDRQDRRDLVAAAAEERLVGHVELGAIDLALDHAHAEQLGADRVHQGRARDALEDVCGDGRRDEPALAYHEERRARALGDVAFLVQEERLIVAVGVRLQGGQPAVLVVGAALQANGDRVVRRASPGAHAALEPVAFLDARPAAWVDVHPGRRRRVEPGAGHVRAHVHVHVFADLVSGKHLAHGLVEVEIAVGNREAHHLHRLPEALEVLGQAEAIELVVAGVPVGAQPLEHVGGVENGRAVYGQDGLRLGHELTVHPDVELFHWTGSFVGARWAVAGLPPRRPRRDYTTSDAARIQDRGVWRNWLAAGVRRPCARVLAPLSVARDLVDEAVVERFPRGEVAPAPHILCDLLGGPAGAPGQAPVEFPQQLLLLTTLRGDLLRGAGEPRLRLGEVEARMRRGGAVIRGRDHGHDRAAHLTPAMNAERRA